MNIKELKEKMIDAEKECVYNVELPNKEQWRENGNINPRELHERHDELLLEYINNSDITEIFNRTDKWYA